MLRKRGINSISVQGDTIMRCGHRSTGFCTSIFNTESGLQMALWFFLELIVAWTKDGVFAKIVKVIILFNCWLGWETKEKVEIRGDITS